MCVTKLLCSAVQQQLKLPFQYGEFVLAADLRGKEKLFCLRKEGVFATHNGHVPHGVIVGHTPGKQYNIKGSHVTFRRPSLWEYVLLMKRGATPTYPKDIWAMLGLLDLSSGQTVLEAGSGSGALTLYLSKHGTEEVLISSFHVVPCVSYPNGSPPTPTVGYHPLQGLFFGLNHKEK